MESILYTIVLFLFFIVCVLTTIYYTHMFQLNSYNTPSQIKWLFKNAFDVLKRIWSLILGIVLCIILKDAATQGIVISSAFILSILFNLPHKAKKPLVYTKRVIRLLITTSIVTILTVVIISTLTTVFSNKLVLLSFLSICSPFIILLCNTINKPLELGINHYYINDAKNIIKSHKTLTTIGVTGSYGKTSVKFMLGTLLEAKYNVLITPESYNTPLGVTKVIRNSLRGTHDIFVCEMGAKKLGEIKEVCDIANPDHGIITSIGPQHLETFKTLDNVKATKFELADALPKTGMLFLNGEDSNIQSFPHNYPFVSYGLSSNCDYFADRITVSSEGTTFYVNHNDESVKFTVSLIGIHNVLNLVGAISICCELGIEMKKLPSYAKKLQPVSHRLQLSKRGNVTIIDDAYNSNPAGAKAAIDVLSLFDGYKTVVTPGMVELGTVQYEENYKFGAYMAKTCDFVALVGPKQTEPIFNGLIENGFDKNKIFVATNINEAIEKIYELDTNNIPKVVLLENDLPDNY